MTKNERLMLIDLTKAVAALAHSTSDLVPLVSDETERNKLQERVDFATKNVEEVIALMNAEWAAK